PSQGTRRDLFELLVAGDVGHGLVTRVATPEGARHRAAGAVRSAGRCAQHHRGAVARGGGHLRASWDAPGVRVVIRSWSRGLVASYESVVGQTVSSVASG